MHPISLRGYTFLLGSRCHQTGATDLFFLALSMYSVMHVMWYKYRGEMYVNMNGVWERARHLGSQVTRLQRPIYAPALGSHLYLLSIDSVCEFTFFYCKQKRKAVIRAWASYVEKLTSSKNICVSGDAASRNSRQRTLLCCLSQPNIRSVSRVLWCHGRQGGDTVGISRV